MTDDDADAAYVLNHGVTTGRIDTPAGTVAIVDGEIPVDDYDLAAHLVAECSAEWPSGDPHPDRDPEPIVDEDADPDPADFDPKHDDARSASRQEIVETYEMLVAEGFADEAELIRFPERYDCVSCDGDGCSGCDWTGTTSRGGNRQHKIARRLSKKHLPGWRPSSRLRW